MAESKRDCYEVLGIKKGATKDEISSAYRKMAKKYHPDINHDPDAPKKFEEIQEAYDILKDDNKRAAYDKYGYAAFAQGGSTGGTGNPFENGGFSSQDFGSFEDLFGAFFGGGARRRSSGAQAGPQKGNDTLYRIRISFMDSINGTHVTVPLTYDEPCEHCHGTGAESPNDVSNCPYCGGTGYVTQRQQSIFGVVETQGSCPHCHGTGKVVRKKCSKCNGEGYSRVHKDIDVTVPSGISNGQQIRVKGKGERGVNGGPNGDLYVEIKVAEDKRFRREGNDIHSDLELNFIDAALGTTCDVETVYGTVSVDIPSGTQPNAILKLKGKGVKDLRSQKPGDQFLHVNLRTPTDLTKTQKDLLLQLKKEEDSKKKGWWKNPFKK